MAYVGGFLTVTGIYRLLDQQTEALRHKLDVEDSQLFGERKKQEANHRVTENVGTRSNLSD